ncbi:MAG TPA: glycosyltransferase [Phycisphaerae bacterium]|nr:glycosyltransferase [Phycisphaerae bacterium]
MHILQVCKADTLGGAERIALTLHLAFRARGRDASLAVDERHTDLPGILQIPPRLWTRLARPLLAPDRAPRGSHTHRLRTWAANPGALRRALLGQDSFAFPPTRRLDSLPAHPPDILHLHNLHSSYFDLRALAPLARRIPLIATLHDAWLLTGGCTHPLNCTRYLSGCGHCPYRHLHFRASFLDSTAFNHRRKKRALRNAALTIVTPCRWLMDIIPGTILEPAIIDRHIIPNGVDTHTFAPADRAAARAALGLPANAHVILHASANPRRNISKDFTTMRAAIARLAAARLGHTPPAPPLLFLVLGEDAPPEFLDPCTEIRCIPFADDPAALVPFYAAADVYLQGSIADTFPNTVLEAMACARPVVATRVGGIPEQILDSRTGHLVNPADPAAMADALLSILRNPSARDALGTAARRRAEEHFTLDRQVDAYLALYQTRRLKTPHAA